MTHKEEIALLKATIEELKVRIVALEARPQGFVPMHPVTPWQQPIMPWQNPQVPSWPTIISSTPGTLRITNTSGALAGVLN